MLPWHQNVANRIDRQPRSEDVPELSSYHILFQKMTLHVLAWAVGALIISGSKVSSQAIGGYTQPYDGGAQPWSNEPAPQYLGFASQYGVTKFSSVRLTGLPLNEPAAQALGLFLPLDKNGDGIVDMMDGRPIYTQRDILASRPAIQDVQPGTSSGRYFLYYRFTLGGWAVDTTIGSEKAMLYCQSSASFAHELHGLRSLSPNPTSS